MRMPSLASNPAPKTVRSAPVSIRKSSSEYVSPAPATRPRTQGRRTRSSQVSHSPTIRIYAWPLTGSHVADQGPIIFGMGPGGPVPCLLRRVGDERFLPGHSDELAARLGQQVGPMGLQPVTVAPAPLILSLAPRRPRPGRSLLQSEKRVLSWFRPRLPDFRRSPSYRHPSEILKSGVEWSGWLGSAATPKESARFTPVPRF